MFTRPRLPPGQGQKKDLPNTRQILEVMCDMRILLTFTLDDCDTILNIIKETPLFAMFQWALHIQ